MAGTLTSTHIQHVGTRCLSGTPWRPVPTTGEGSDVGTVGPTIGGTESLLPKQLDKIVRATATSSRKDTEIKEPLLSSVIASLTSSREDSVVSGLRTHTLPSASQGSTARAQAGAARSGKAPPTARCVPRVLSLSAAVTSKVTEDQPAGGRQPGGGHRVRKTRNGKPKPSRKSIRDGGEAAAREWGRVGERLLVPGPGGPS